MNIITSVNKKKIFNYHFNLELKWIGKLKTYNKFIHLIFSKNDIEFLS